jgi:hypothetical protein
MKNIFSSQSTGTGARFFIQSLQRNLLNVWPDFENPFHDINIELIPRAIKAGMY